MRLVFGPGRYTTDGDGLFILHSDHETFACLRHQYHALHRGFIGDRFAFQDCHCTLQRVRPPSVQLSEHDVATVFVAVILFVGLHRTANKVELFAPITAEVVVRDRDRLTAAYEVNPVLVRCHLHHRCLPRFHTDEHDERGEAHGGAMERLQRVVEPNAIVQDIPTGNVANESRRVFIDQDTIDMVIAACPDDQWRMIFALARYGGLRIPSEIHGLKWSDIDWDKKQFRVHSPKTEHIEGKGSRDVPLFPELVPYFDAWKEQRQDGEPLVFPALAKRGNLRQYAHRIIRKAGIEPWTRVYQNLRASRETELVEEFPVHVVTAWLGNTPDVAAKHYLSVLPSHLEKAVSQRGSAGGSKCGTDMGHSIAVRGCQEMTYENADASQVPDVEAVDSECRRESISGKSGMVPRRGLEPPTYGLGIRRSVLLSYRGVCY